MLVRHVLGVPDTDCLASKHVWLGAAQRPIKLASVYFDSRVASHGRVKSYREN